MVVKDGAESARVLMKDHGFAVPMDSRGKSVVVEGTLYSSQPVALRDHGATVAIERIREIIRADGRRSASDDILHLDRVEQREIEDEARAAGLTPLPGRIVPATEEHVGTSVVILRG